MDRCRINWIGVIILLSFVLCCKTESQKDEQEICKGDFLVKFDNMRHIKIPKKIPSSIELMVNDSTLKIDFIDCFGNAIHYFKGDTTYYIADHKVYIDSVLSLNPESEKIQDSFIEYFKPFRDSTGDYSKPLLFPSLSDEDPPSKEE